MSISIATVFQEEVIKTFRQHLPKECVELLVMMANQNLMLEKVLNDHQRIITALVKTVDTFGNHHKQLQEQLDKIEKKYDGSDLVEFEKMQS